ncbi:cell division protein FtsA [candidate division NPL-UPA2 bacterium]|nr:cell division protein FtsA [candidate division NPL-UPA2 bacterium]
MKKQEFVVGLDIGTTKICAMVGRRDGDGEAEIVGTGVAPSKGLRKGVVINLESTIDSVERAIEKAEEEAGVEVSRVFTGIAGGHIRGFNSRGVVGISRSSREVSRKDVERVINATKAVAIPLDQEVIHVIPQEFTVDDQDGVKNPIGMSANRLEAEVHIVTGAVTSAQNIIKSVNWAGFEVEDIVLGPLASAEAVLSPEEKRSGVVLIDIGGGTTDMVIFSQSSIRHSEVLSLGGDHVTNDISVGLRTSPQQAEEVKKAYGCATASLIKREEFFRYPGVGGRRGGKVSLSQLCEVIEPRIEELFSLVSSDIDRTGLAHSISAGVVLTGGASLLRGLPEMAERILRLPVRLGRPNGRVRGLGKGKDSPIYATAVGLVHYGLTYRQGKKMAPFKGRNLFSQVALRMKEWLGEFF